MADRPSLEERLALAASDGLPEDEALRLADDPADDVIATVAARPDVSGEVLAVAARRAKASLAVARALAGNPATSSQIAGRLAALADWDVLRQVGIHPSLPPSACSRLAKAPFWGIRAAVAGNLSCPTDLLVQLSVDVPAVQFEVAGNPSTPPEVLARLSALSDPVAARAAANPSTPAHILDALAARTDVPSWVTRAAAGNPSCPTEAADATLTWLALGGAEDDPSFDPVTCNGHPGPREVNAHYWYGQAADDEASGAAGSTSPLWRVRFQWMDLNLVSTSAAAQIACDPRPEVRQRLAGFRPLPAIVVEQLANDPDEHVVSAVCAVQPGRPLVARQRSARSGKASSAAIAIVISAVLIPVRACINARWSGEAVNQAVANSLSPLGTFPENDVRNRFVPIENLPQFDWAPDPSTSAPSVSGRPPELVVGTCFNDIDELGMVLDARFCSQAHEAEVLAIDEPIPCERDRLRLRTLPHPDIRIGTITAGQHVFCVVAAPAGAGPTLTESFAEE